MKPFLNHHGVVVPLDHVDVDTDAIVPKQFLKRLERKGLGEILFYDWRFDDDGSENEQFSLNSARYMGGSILLTRSNFGCGSSREHAPWALQDYGFKVIIASSFADIFYNNCFKNGLLPVIVDENVIDQLFQLTMENERFSLHVDLKLKVIYDGEHVQTAFEVNELFRNRLMNGLDDITSTLNSEYQIDEFEKQRPSWLNP